MNRSLLCAVIGAVSSLAQAQSTERVIPPVANGIEANDIARYPFGRTGFRTQQLIDESAILSTTGVILTLEYRADTGNSSGSSAVTIPNVTIEMSQTVLTPANMSTIFAHNITGTPVVVFSGPVTLPAYSSGPGAVAPWVSIPLTAPFVMAPGQGNLLIDIVAANAGGTSTGYVLDAALPGGAVESFGTGGALSQQDGVRTTISGNGAMGRYSGIVPGGQFSILVQSQFRSWSGALMLGFAPQPSPIDLAIFGAPGNSLYIDPIDSYPYTLQRTLVGFGYRSTWPLAVPANPNLTGASLYLQPLVQDPAANALGVVTSNAVRVAIGDAALHPVRQLNASDHTAPTGRYQYVSNIHGGAVMRLTGVFQ